MGSKQGRLADVLDTDTTPFWMMTLSRKILTPTALARYCEWEREQVLKADREITPTVSRTDFDFFKADSNSQVWLSQAASIGTKLFIERKVMKVICEPSFVSLRMNNEGIAKEVEETLIRICLKELNGKLEEFAEYPWLLPSEGLLTLR